MEVVDGQYWSHSFSMLTIESLSLLLLVVGCIAFYLARKHSLAAQRAHIAISKKVGLFVGDAFVTGITETHDKAPAIRVEITQIGKERKQKNGYSHTWTEFDRTQSTRPFRLRIPGGTGVFVEPGAEVFLVDDLVQKERIDSTTRVMCAELTHGEEVTIEGVLTREMRPSSDGEGDYRGQQKSWVLRPPSHGKMLLSTEPLPVRHEKRARFWMLTCAACCLFFALAHTGLYASGFWRLVMNSECSDVEVIDHRHWTTRGRHGQRHHTSIVGRVTGLCTGGEGRTPIGTAIDEEVSAHYPEGAHVPFQVEAGDPSKYRLGSGVGLSSLEWWILVIASIVLGVWGYTQHRAALAWYETKLKQSYPGRLD